MKFNFSVILIILIEAGRLLSIGASVPNVIRAQC